MRIVLVNWAKIWEGASVGGGVNGYCQALALALVARGHEVVSLSSGTTFVPAIAGGREAGACEVRRHPDWLGVRVFEVVNSPVLAPSLHQFREPRAEVSSPVLEGEVSRLLRLIRPDVVHFHNVEGFSAGCVRAARDAGARVVFSLHNYHTVCPQVYLMQGNRRPCHDFRNGHACGGCIEAPDPAAVRLQALGVPTGVATSNPAPIATGLRGIARRMLEGGGAGRSAGSAPAVHSPGSGVSDCASALEPLPHSEPDGRGQIARVVSLGRSAADHAAADRRPLTNEISPEPPTDLAPAAYADRRREMVAMLNACDAVLAVSPFVMKKFQSMGVAEERLRVVTIGTRMAEIAGARPELLAPPPPFEAGRPRPIRLVFIGFNNWAKGLPMLADSLDLLGPADLARYHLAVYAFGGRTVEHRFRRLEARLAGLIFRHGYEFHDLPWLLGGQDAGIVPSVWWDNGPQTVLEFQACGVPVLGAAAGGIPDMVRDGVDGLLFRANDREGLAVLLGRIAGEPSILTRLHAGVRPPKGMDEHAAELELVYGAGVP